MNHHQDRSPDSGHSGLFRSLQAQINLARKTQREYAIYTRSYVDCLIHRHDLPNMLADDQEIEGIPPTILAMLRCGTVPAADELAALTLQEQDRLIRDLVWIAGHGAIRWYREKGLSEASSELETEQKMLDWTTEEWAASHVRAALALLLACDPPADLMDILLAAEIHGLPRLERLCCLHRSLQDSILRRHEEDRHYWTVNLHGTPFHI